MTSGKYAHKTEVTLESRRLKTVSYLLLVQQRAKF